MKRIKTFQRFLYDTGHELLMPLSDSQLEYGIDASAELNKILNKIYENETEEVIPFNFTPSQNEIPETPVVDFDYTKVTDWCQIPF